MDRFPPQWRRYFLGAIYINYGLTVIIALAGYFAVDAWVGLSVTTQLWLWGTFTVLFPLWAYRYSKALWLSLDHLVDPGDGPGTPRSPERRTR